MPSNPSFLNVCFTSRHLCFPVQWGRHRSSSQGQTTVSPTAFSQEEKALTVQGWAPQVVKDMQNFSSQSQWVYLYHYQSPEKQSSKRGLMTCPFKVLEQVSALVTLPPLRTCLSRAHRAYRHQLSLVISHFVVKYPGVIMTEPKMCSLWGFLKFLEREGKYTVLVD